MPSRVLEFLGAANMILLALSVFMAMRRYWLLAIGTLVLTIGNAIDLASRMGYLSFAVGTVASLIGTLVFAVAIFSGLRGISRAAAEGGKHSA